MAVDEELKAAVKAAKSKRCYFAFIQKSASDGTLLVGKSKIPDKDITAAKKKNGGSTTLKGACFGDGEKFVFEMSKEPQDKEKLEGALNKVAKRDAGVSIDALVRKGNSPDLLDDKPNEDNPYGTPIPVPEDTTQTSGASPQVDNPYGTPIPVHKKGTTSPKVDNPYGTPIPVGQSGNGDLYYQKRKPLEGKLAEGLEQRRGDSPKLRQVFAYAEGAANKKEFDKGIQGLDVLDKMLAKPSAPAPQIGDQRRIYFQRRKPLEPKIVAFLKAKHPEGERVATTFKVAEHRAKEEDFPVAMQAPRSRRAIVAQFWIGPRRRNVSVCERPESSDQPSKQRRPRGSAWRRLQRHQSRPNRNGRTAAGSTACLAQPGARRSVGSKHESDSACGGTVR